MTSFRTDPLLGSLRAMLTFAMVVLAAALLACALAVPTIALAHGRLLVALSDHLPKAANLDFVLSAEGLLVCALLLIGATWTFIRKLRQIIDTVATGDPFTPENADRLRAMAWLAIDIQLLGIPIGILALRMADKIDAHHVKLDFSLGGILLALVLFILARVFRTGAAMREELEGTV